ncbi:hypothetical protein [Nocardioides humi]|uniref:Uncharacterized protein n=1 Tax=Nocardioides humi TaxID=449461 RepID=A0ABN2AIE9_9ACTN|nr:hypothetical protein [Nocardioides humi]
MSLMLLGGFLVVVGLCDLLRIDRDRITPLRQALLIAIGGVLVAGFLCWVQDAPAGAVAVGIGLLAALAAWVIGSSAALSADGRAAARWRAVAFAGLGGGAVLSLLGVGVLVPWATWPGWLADTVLVTWPPADVTVSAGAVLLQLATGNRLVHLILDAAGLSAAETALKGERILGPVERILIVGLGHLGEVTAAAILVVAKGLLRLPELQARTKDGPGDVTAAFVVGSLTSWLIGLAGVALIYVA